VTAAADAARIARGTLPECNAETRGKLAGRYWTTPATATDPSMRFVCQEDNNWAPVPMTVADLQPPTPAQELAVQRDQAGGANNNGGDSRAERRKAARDAALNSSSIALHFGGKPNAAPVELAAATPPSTSTAVPRSDTDADDEERVTEKPHKYDWDTYTGQLYRVFEGDFIEAILAQRLQGEFTGPVNVMLTTNLYSHDNRHILMPQGTRILGTASRVSGAGQKRLQLAFHRIIMPDGYSVDIEKFAGLDQQGATGVTGRVDTHWKKVVGVAVLVGAIQGLSQLSSFGGAGGGGVVQIQSGVSQQSAQQGLQILQNAMNVLPTVTVYEGTRVRLWVRRDMELPAYENHTVVPNL
jgi:type IV secretory pathway VirB10-like protein